MKNDNFLSSICHNCTISHKVASWQGMQGGGGNSPSLNFKSVEKRSSYWKIFAPNTERGAKNPLFWENLGTKN